MSVNIFDREEIEQISSGPKPQEIDIFSEDATPYDAINKDTIASQRPVDSIKDMSVSEAFWFSSSMGASDTYRGIQQLRGKDLESMRMEQRRLNSLFESDKHGTTALLGYIAGVIADPAGWALPVMKAKSIGSLVAQGIGYGGVAGFTGYVDEDNGQERLTNAAFGSLAGGGLTGVLGLVGRKHLGFDEPKKDVDLDEILGEEIQRDRKKRRRNAEKARYTNGDEELTYLESFKKNVSKPVYDSMVRNPLGYTTSAVLGYNVFNNLEDAQSSEDFLKNAALTTLAFVGGKKIGDYANKTEIADKVIGSISTEAQLNRSIIAKKRQMDSNLLGYQGKLARLADEAEKLDEADRKILYQVMSGDLTMDEVYDLDAGEKIFRKTLPYDDKVAAGKTLTKEQALEREGAAAVDVPVEDYLGISLPTSVKDIAKLNDKKIKLFKELGEDLRDAGLLDDDVFKTNIDTYIKRLYNLENNNNTEFIKKSINNLLTIRGDSLRPRGTQITINTAGRTEKEVLDEVNQLVTGLEKERKIDYKTKNDYEKRYEDQTSFPNSSYKKRVGKIINRVAKDDPRYIKGVDDLDQPSNYGILVKKDDEGNYVVNYQLTKKQRQGLKEIEDAAKGIKATAMELNSTLGLGKFYQGLYDIGLQKGFVRTQDSFLNKALNDSNITKIIGADGKPVYSTPELTEIAQKMSEIRTTQTMRREVGNVLTDLEYIRLKTQFNQLQKATNEKAQKIERKINRTLKQSIDEAPLIMYSAKDNEGRILGEYATREEAKEVLIKNRLDTKNIGEEEYVFVPDKKINVTKKQTLAQRLINKQRDEQSQLTEAEKNIFQPRISKYGKLTGNLVKRKEFNDIKFLQEAVDSSWARPFGESYFTMQSFWKKTKTVYNPVVHFNNFVSNISLYYLSGGNWTELAKSFKYGKLMRQYDLGKIEKEQLPKDLQEMVDEGVFGADYITAELKKGLNPDEIYKTINISSADKPGGLFNVIFDSLPKQFKNAKKLFGENVDAPLTAWYQFEDRIFRYGLYRTKRKEINPETGKLYTQEEAADAAIRQFVDYDIKSNSVNALRNTAVPFLSYSYRMIPILTKAAISTPERMAVLGLGMYLIDDEMRIRAGDTQQEQRRQRQYMQGTKDDKAFSLPFMPYSNIRLPYDSKEGVARYFDIGRKLPGGDIFKMEQELGQPVPGIPSILGPGGPGLDFINKIVVGRDPFTGQSYNPIDEKSTPIGGALGYRVGKFAEGFVPNLPLPFEDASFGLISDTPAYKKIERTFTPGARKGLSEDLSKTETLLNSIGLSINEADVSKLSDISAREIRRLNNNLKQATKSLAVQVGKKEITARDYHERLNKLKETYKREVSKLTRGTR